MYNVEENQYIKKEEKCIEHTIDTKRMTCSFCKRIKTTFHHNLAKKEKKSFDEFSFAEYKACFNAEWYFLKLENMNRFIDFDK